MGADVARLLEDKSQNSHREISPIFYWSKQITWAAQMKEHVSRDWSNGSLLCKHSAQVTKSGDGQSLDPHGYCEP